MEEKKYPKREEEESVGMVNEPIAEPIGFLLENFVYSILICNFAPRT